MREEGESYTAMRPEEGVIIEETICVAISHVEGSTTPQRAERKKHRANGELSVATVEAGVSTADGDQGTNREPLTSPPETVYASSVQQSRGQLT